MNESDFDQYRNDYIHELKSEGHEPDEWEDPDSGESGASLGSILGQAIGSIEDIFLVKNTTPDDGRTLYFGAKKEGVYGSSDLVVYATLDQACRLSPQNPPRNWWYLHLEKDTGQQQPADDTEPFYVRPDLSTYRDGMFFRLRNVASGKLLYAKDDAASLGVRTIDVPFNPLEYPEYWSLTPNGSDSIHNIKILNSLNRKWLTCYSSSNNSIGLYPVGYADYPDQHWNVIDWTQNPQIVKLANSAVNGRLVGSTADDSVFLYPDIESAEDQQWRPESFCVDVADIPDGRSFRIMHAKDGYYISAVGEGDGECGLFSYVSPQTIFGIIEHEQFTLRNAGSGYYICRTGKDLYLRFEQSTGKLRLDTFSDTQEILWDFRTLATRSGFIITNRAPWTYGSQLYYSNGGFGLYHGDYDDQIWVAQLD